MRAASGKRSRGSCGPSGRRGIDKVAGIEARGLILGGAVALELGAGFAPVRKRGKLPWQTIGEDYLLEYGSDRVEMHRDAIAPGERVLLVDDLVATGGTAEAAIRVIQKLGGEVVGCAVIIDLPALGGSRRIASLGHRGRVAHRVRGRVGHGAALRAGGAHRRTIRRADGGQAVEIIDQTRLPFELCILRLETLEDAAEAIAQMRVRGAPLIGATAAYGVCLALRQDASDAALASACRRLLATRPTAVNLKWALDEMAAALADVGAARARGAGLGAGGGALRGGRRGLPRDRRARREAARRAGGAAGRRGR